MNITLPPDPFSFLVGFFVGIVFVWLLSRVRPVLKQLGESAKEKRQAAQSIHRSSSS